MWVLMRAAALTCGSRPTRPLRVLLCAFGRDGLANVEIITGFQLLQFLWIRFSEVCFFVGIVRKIKQFCFALAIGFFAVREYFLGARLGVVFIIVGPALAVQHQLPIAYSD